MDENLAVRGESQKNSFHRECLIVQLPYVDGNAQGAAGGALDSNLRLGTTCEPSLL
jgi:hypothetical protein